MTETPETLDPHGIMEQLRALEATLRQDGWHVLISVTYRPHDGSGGVTFTVGAEPAVQSDD